MHHYPFNIGDYRKDTGYLSIIEHGIYRLLIDTYYLTELPLSLDHRELCRLHCIRSENERMALENILADFFTKTESGYTHTGCQKVLGKIYEKSEKARQSAERKWEIERAKKCERSEKECERNANACETDANALKSDAPDMLPITQHPTPNTQHPIPNNTPLAKAVVEIDFEEFWNIYPKKVGVEVARKAWKKLKPNQLVFDLIKTHLSYAYIATEKQYIPNGATYLNQKRWTDEVITAKPINNLSAMNYGESGDL